MSQDCNNQHFMKEEINKVYKVMYKEDVNLMATELGVNPRTIYRWLNGDSKPRGEAMYAMIKLIEDVNNGDNFVNEDAQPYFVNTNGNEFTQLMNGDLQIKCQLVPFRIVASEIDWLDDGQVAPNQFEEVYFTVSKVGKGNYVAFRVSGDSMFDGSFNGTPDDSLILTRELQRHHWQDGFHKCDYGWVLMTTNYNYFKDIKEFDKSNGYLTLSSKNNSPEYSDFKIHIDDVYKIYKVLKREF